MSKRNDTQLIKDMIEAANKIEAYTKFMLFVDFLNDNKTLDAVVRNFEIIGEAANRLTDAFKEKHEEIEWHKIRGFRNRIVHDYIDIDYEIVWQIKEDYLPTLINRLNNLFI